MNYLGILVYLSDHYIWEGFRKAWKESRKGWVKLLVFINDWQRPSFSLFSFYTRLVESPIRSARPEDSMVIHGTGWVLSSLWMLNFYSYNCRKSSPWMNHQLLLGGQQKGLDSLVLSMITERGSTADEWRLGPYFSTISHIIVNILFSFYKPLFYHLENTEITS